MLLERLILYSSIILTIIALIIFIPRKMIRVATAGILFKQIITWSLGIFTVELGLLDYPIRLFEEVNRTSFTFEYIVYPAICAIFIVHYPEHKGKLYRFGYYAIYCTILSGIEIILEHTTQLIRYIHWDWYWTWISLLITFGISRQFYKWYFYKLLRYDPATVE